MGCGPSKHEDTEQAVDLVLFCRERKRCIKEAVTYRTEFATAHAAYIHLLKNVGTTLTRLMEGEDTELISDSFRFSSSPGTTSSVFTTEVGSTSQAQKSVSPTPSSPPAETHVVLPPETAAAPMAMETHNKIQTQKQQKEEEEEENSSSESESEENHVVSHLRSMTTQSTLFYQGRPSSPETYTMSSYSAQNSGSGGGFLSSYFEPLPPRHGSQFGLQNAEDAAVPLPPSPPPSNSTWDFFNPFSSLENMYGYQTRRLSQVFDEEEFKDLNRLRQEEGIPELEDVSESSKKQQEKKAEDVANPAKENIVPPAPQEPAKEAVADKEQSQKQAIPENEQSQKEAVRDKEQAKEEASTSAVKGETETFVEESKVDALTQTPSEPKVIESTSEAKAQVTTKEEALNVVQKSEERPADPNQPIQQEATSKRSNMFQIIKDIEYQFLRAYEAGIEVSGLLEVSKIPRSSSFRGLRDQSARVLSSIMRSSSSRASSFRSQFAVVDNMDDSSSDIGEECGMLSGCHSSTLDRLAAWEKKLYQEVKAGDGVRMEYERKCALLRMQESKGYDHHLIDDTRSTVKHLHTQITVNIQQTEKFFTNIRSLANRQLQPQLKELIMGLKKMWSIMLECHQMQHQCTLELKHLNDAAAYWICVESNPKLTIQLERELWTLHDAFTRLFDSQRAYVQALTGWLSRCVNIDTESSAKVSKATLSPHRTIAPDVFHICRDWCQALTQIQEKAVVNAIKSFAQDLHELWAKQEEEKKHKKRVEHYEKGLVKKMGGLQKVESKRHEKLSSFEQPETVDPVIEQRKMSVESFRKVVDNEKEKHQKILMANRSTVMNVLQKGLAFTFETLIKFSEQSSKKYEHILENCDSRT